MVGRQGFLSLSSALVSEALPSIVVGNIIELFSDTTRMCGVKWQSEYGTVMKLHGQIGTSDAILVSDPAALRYIYQSDRSNKFIRSREWYSTGNLLFGQSIGTAEGDEHKRQRKVCY